MLTTMGVSPSTCCAREGEIDWYQNLPTTFEEAAAVPVAAMTPSRNFATKDTFSRPPPEGC